MAENDEPVDFSPVHMDMEKEQQSEASYQEEAQSTTGGMEPSFNASMLTTSMGVDTYKTTGVDTNFLRFTLNFNIKYYYNELILSLDFT